MHLKDDLNFSPRPTRPCRKGASRVAWIRLLALRKPLARGCLWVQASIAVSDPFRPLERESTIADNSLCSDAPMPPTLLARYVTRFFQVLGAVVPEDEDFPSYIRSFNPSTLLWGTPPLRPTHTPPPIVLGQHMPELTTALCAELWALVSDLAL